jgi:hypothetical protein
MLSFATGTDDMPKKPRDYAAEYASRIQRGLKRGWSRSKARGHGKVPRRRGKSTPRTYGKEFEAALRALRVFKNQKRAAQSAGISPKRFRQFIREKRLAHFRKGKWRFTDRRTRSVRAITTRGEKELKVRGFDAASTVMYHRAAVKNFLADPDLSLLKPFEGASVTDTDGRTYELETRPNVLYRLSAAGTESYEEIYRLTT